MLDLPQHPRSSVPGEADDTPGGVVIPRLRLILVCQYPRIRGRLQCPEAPQVSRRHSRCAEAAAGFPRLLRYSRERIPVRLVDDVRKEKDIHVREPRLQGLDCRRHVISKPVLADQGQRDAWQFPADVICRLLPFPVFQQDDTERKGARFPDHVETGVDNDLSFPERGQFLGERKSET
jgi:hypothetical protein